MKRIFNYLILISLVTGCKKDVVPPIDIDTEVYYVAMDGDDLNPGTTELPWATWEKAFNTAEAGDTVFIRGGNYAYPDRDFGIFVSDRDGVEGYPICIFNFPGEIPVLDFKERSAKGYKYGIYLNECEFWHLKGISIKNLDQSDDGGTVGFVAKNCDNIVYENVSAHHIGGTGFVVWELSERITYRNCDSYSNYDYKSEISGQGADGFVGNTHSRTSRLAYIGCRSWNNSDDGYDFWDNEGVVRIDSCWSFSNGYAQGDGSGFKLGRTSKKPLNEYQRILNNCVAYNNLHVGYDQNAGDVKIRLYNNISYANKQRGYALNSGEEEIILKNSIAFRNSEVGAFGSNVLQEYNQWNLGIQVDETDFISVDSAGIRAERNPDGSLKDSDFLRLSPDSDLIDAGTDVGLPFLGNSPDLGPFERQ